jgi:N-acetylglutamate synthase-like GNAT family acetyltransferase
MRIRPATANDAARIRGLIDLFTADGTLLPRTEDFIAAQAHNYLVAEMRLDGVDTVVGCAHLDEYSPSVAELRSLAVVPGHQGAGIGRALVEGIERLARKRDHMLLFAVSNDEAFFARFGFASAHVPELDRERSEVSRYKGVHVKALRQPHLAAA